MLASWFTIAIKRCTNRSGQRILMMTNLSFISSNKFEHRKFAVLLKEAGIFENSLLSTFAQTVGWLLLVVNS